ncbi:hypothetical protein BGZ49_000799 [Haplosporangium sp. Z 27]|nr:hypothetical protein BGZ49_000799 [Haplosporangium sp. Z 27]
MDRNPKKHDLDKSHHNVREQPIPKRKRPISLRRPHARNLSEPLSDQGTRVNDQSSNCIPTATAATSPDSGVVSSISTTDISATFAKAAVTQTISISITKQDATQYAEPSQSYEDPEACIVATKSPEHQRRLSVPDNKDQDRRSVQENDDVKAEEISDKFTKETKGVCDSTDARDITIDTPEAGQADWRISKCHAGPTTLKDALRSPVNADDKSSDPKDCPLLPTHSRSVSIDDSIPDTDFDQDNDCSEFLDIDEIQDWDFDDTESPQDAHPIPDNTCPICNLDLSTLDTMTPDAHVNRCLDGEGSDPAIAVPSMAVPITAVPTTTVPAAAARQGHSSGSFSVIMGTIRSTVTNFTLGSGISNMISTSNSSLDKKANKQFKPKAPKPCPFYKKMPGTSFTVDAFCYGAIDGCDAYFLSHFHSDHYGGLTSSWNHGLIYCSSITANLVIRRLNVDSQFVRRLPMYEPTVINGVTVRLMDANHCPGSVLFVFDLVNPKRRYLHTGDFRACPEMALDTILRQPPNIPIDILYLDTTYSNPQYTFPSQDLVIKETANLVCREIGIQADQVPVPAVVQTPRKVNIMEKWLKKESGNNKKLLTMSMRTEQSNKSKQKWQYSAGKNRVVVCVGTYLIGKERVFMAIAKAIKSKVYVQHSKLQILSCLEDPELMEMLTSDQSEAQVHLMHMGSGMSPENLQEYLESMSPAFTHLIAIRPTGWTFTGGSKRYTSADNRSVDVDQVQTTPTPTTLNLKPSFTSSTVKIYPVPYSEHSSFNELAGFVRSLDIVKIIPTVGVGSENGRHTMSEWFRRWEKERRQGIGWE